MKKLKEVERKIGKEEKFWKAFYTLILFLGAISMLFAILIYRKTIIETYIPISIILVVGFLAFYFNKQHYKKTYFLTSNFNSIMQNLISWGFISSYIFMATNYYLAENISTNYKFKIKEKSSMPGSKYHRSEREPLVRFDYFDFEKELVFHFSDTEKVNSADSVKVSIKKGGLGFDILESYDIQ
jgi:hypothetical protein